MGIPAVERALSPSLSTRIKFDFELIFKLKPPDHEIHQAMPTLKDHIACERPKAGGRPPPSGGLYLLRRLHQSVELLRQNLLRHHAYSLIHHLPVFEHQ